MCTHLPCPFSAIFLVKAVYNTCKIIASVRYYVYQREGSGPEGATHTPEPGPQKGLETVDAKESSVFRPRKASEDHHPHACSDGLVFLTYVVFDEAVGDEVERIEALPCRRCAEE
jgi:hypothetical protein